MTVVWVVLGVVGVFVIAWLISYNRFVRQRNHIKESWADVDTELRRRYDLVPNLVETVKGYAAHERQTFEAVTAARGAAAAASGDAASQAVAENGLIGALRQLFAVAEAYPTLQANDAFLDLQRQLVETEDRIQVARRLYNGNVRDFNRRVESFPSMLVARAGHFTVASYFEIDAAIRTADAPKVG